MTAWTASDLLKSLVYRLPEDIRREVREKALRYPSTKGGFVGLPHPDAPWQWLPWEEARKAWFVQHVLTPDHDLRPWPRGGGWYRPAWMLWQGQRVGLTLLPPQESLPLRRFTPFPFEVTVFPPEITGYVPCDLQDDGVLVVRDLKKALEQKPLGRTVLWVSSQDGEVDEHLVLSVCHYARAVLRIPPEALDFLRRHSGGVLVSSGRVWWAPDVYTDVEPPMPPHIDDWWPYTMAPLVTAQQPRDIQWARDHGLLGVGLIRLEAVDEARRILDAMNQGSIRPRTSQERMREVFQRFLNAAAGMRLVVFRARDTWTGHRLRGVLFYRQEPHLLRLQAQALADALTATTSDVQVALAVGQVMSPEDWVWVLNTLRDLPRGLWRVPFLESLEGLYHLRFFKHYAPFISLGTNDLMAGFAAGPRVAPARALHERQGVLASWRFFRFLRDVLTVYAPPDLPLAVCGVLSPLRLALLDGVRPVRYVSMPPMDYRRVLAFLRRYRTLPQGLTLELEGA